MSSLGDMTVSFGADTSGLSGGIGDVASKLGGLSGIAESALGPVGTILAGVATVAIGVGVASVKLAGDFQESMDKVQAYAGLSKTATEQMGQSILAMAPALGQSPKALADGLYFVASAGFRGADALNVLKYAGMTAAASNVSATVTASALVSAINGLGLKGKDAGNVMDVLNATVSDGVLSWDDYGRVVGKMASAFVGTGESVKQMKVNFVDANAGLDLFTNAGVSARLAATNLSSTINILENKTDSIATHASKMGLSFDETKFKTMDLQDQMQYLGKITDNNSGEMIKLMGGNSGAAKTIDFLNANSQKYGQTISDINSKMQNGATTQDKFNIASQGFNFQMEKAKDTIQAVGIKIGTALLPVLSNIMSFITPLIGKFSDWISSSDGLGSVIGGLGAKFAPVIGAFQTLGGFVSKFNWEPLIKAAQNLFGAFQMLPTPMNEINQSLKPQVWAQVAQVMEKIVSGGATGLAAVFNGIATAIRVVVPIMESWTAWLAGNFEPLWGQLVSMFQNDMMPALHQLGQSLQTLMPVWIALGAIIGGVVVVFIGNAIAVIRGLLGAVITFIGGFVKMLSGMVEIFAGIFTVLWNIVKFFIDLFTGHWSNLAGDLGGIWDGIKMIFQGGCDFMSGLIEATLGTIASFVSNFVASFIGFFQHLWDELVGHSIIPDMIAAIISAFTGFFSTILSSISGWIMNMLGFFDNLSTQAGQKITSMCDLITSILTNFISGAANFGANLIKGIIGGITGAMGGLGNAMHNVVGFIGSFLPHSPAEQGELSHLNDYGPAFVEGFASGIEDSIPRFQTALDNLFQPVPITMHQAAPTSYGSSSGTLAMQHGQQGKSGGHTIENHIHIHIDGQELTNVLTPKIASEIIYRARSGGPVGKAA